MTCDNSNTEKPLDYDERMNSYHDKQITPNSGQPDSFYNPAQADTMNGLMNDPDYINWLENETKSAPF